MLRTRTRLFRTQVIGSFLSYLRSRGVDPAPLIDRFNLPATAETDPEVTLPLDRLYAFQEACAAATGDRFFGLHVALAVHCGTFQWLEYICRNTGSLRMGVRDLIRYGGLLNDSALLAFHESNGLVTIELKLPGAPLCLGRHLNEHALATLLTVGRQVCGVDWIPQRVQFAHPGEAESGELVRAFGTAHIEFGALLNRLCFASSVLDLPVISYDPNLYTLLEKHARQQLRTGPRPVEFIDRVREQIRNDLGRGEMTLMGIAGQLGMSSRSLQRRLQLEHVAFQELVEQVRREMADIYLADVALPFSEIAFLLGYSDPSPFFRWFKSRSGVTPQQYRLRLRGTPAFP